MAANLRLQLPPYKIKIFAPLEEIAEMFFVRLSEFGQFKTNLLTGFILIYSIQEVRQILKKVWQNEFAKILEMSPEKNQEGFFIILPGLRRVQGTI